LSAQKLGELGLWLCRLGIQPYRIAKHRFGFAPIVQTGRRGTERSPDPAFKNGGPITRLDQIENVGEFSLPEQGAGKNW